MNTKRRLLSILSGPARSAEVPVNVEAALKAHTAGAEQSDDATMLVVRRL